MTIILVTGAREWKDRQAVRAALAPWVNKHNSLYHGAAIGLDTIAEGEWLDMCQARGFTGSYRRFYAKDYPKPHPDRNQAMVDACDARDAVCLAFALKWGSGTGGCARLARKAGIKTYDVGVDTGWQT